jgi:hypothetical protein
MGDSMRAGFGLALIMLAQILAMAGCAGAAASQERPAWLRMAMAAEAVDPQALRNAADPASEEQQKLVSAIELAWLRRDAEAAVALRTSADTAREVALRLDSLNMLMAVHLRAGDYALAAAAGRESKGLAPPSPGQSDLLVAAEALKGTPPMTLSGNTRGMLPLKVEKDGIPRARVTINGLDQEAFLDTGAGFSAISQSVAKRAGVRPLKASMRVVPGGGAVANADIGVADELVIAEAKFRNVVVLILPDDDMDILGDTKMGAIVGLPVFLKMGSIAILPEPDSGGLAFAFRPSNGRPSEASNMRLHKLSLVLSGTLKRPEPAAVNMLLDTGASGTSFNTRFAASFPELVADAPKVSTKSSVIGEASLSRQARRLGELSFDVGGTTFTIAGADVHEDRRPAYHGILGQNVLRIGFIADFEAMIFELAPRGLQVKSGAP